MFDLERASRVQCRLASRLELRNEGGKVRLVAGADFSYNRKNSLIGAAIAVMKIPELEIVDAVEEVYKVNIPYIPEYLGFREGPVFIRAFLKIKDKPDVTMVDGNGIAHPRRMGLASYVGVVLDVPTIGCAKRSFYPFRPPALQRGAYSLYKDENNRMVGFCLRTSSSVKPIFVSPGHRTDFVNSRDLVLKCSRFRIPEPLRAAHGMAKRIFLPGNGGSSF